MVMVTFIHPDGVEERIPAKVGETVMDVAVDHGVSGIHGRCGGACHCCSCHCWVEAPWFDQLDTPHPDEADMLVYAWGVAHDSRLSCQIKLTWELDGIRVRVPEKQS